MEENKHSFAREHGGIQPDMSVNNRAERSVILNALNTRRAIGRNAEHVRRNFRLSVANGTLGGVTNNFLNPELILAGFIYVLTGSAFAVAAVTVLHKAGTMIPQLIVGNMVEPFSRRRPLYALSGAVRVGAIILLASGMFLSAAYESRAGIALFYFSVLLYACATGAGGIIHNDMLGRLIPPHRVGTLLGMRKVFGGTFAVLAGAMVIQPILGGADFPVNYLFITGIGTAILIVQLVSWCVCREHAGHRTSGKKPLGRAIHRGFSWLRDDWNYRCYMWLRFSFRVSYVGLAFFIPYGTQSLGYPASAGGLAVLGGLLVAVRKVSEIIFTPLWSRIADAGGSRRALAGAAAVTFAAPLLALSAGRMPGMFSLEVPGLAYPLDFPLVVFLGALSSIGAGFSGILVAGQRFLITNAPAAHRPSYLAFINTLLSPLTLLPLAGAWIAQAAGMDLLFVLVAAGAFTGVTAALRMRPEKTSAD